MPNPIDTQTIQSAISSLSAAQIAIIASSVGAVVAALIAALFSLLTTWLVKRAENKRAIQELIIKSSIELYSHHLEFAKQQGSPILPIDTYIVHLVTTANVLLRKRITKENVVSLLDEINAISDLSETHLSKTRAYKVEKEKKPIKPDGKV